MTVPVAGRTMIELGARASVLEVVERIAAAPAADEIVLSISAGAPAARNAVFLEVARRAAGTRRLAIVSADARARSLASSVHLPAFASTAALERQELDATEQLTTARRAALARPVKVKRVTGPSPITAFGILGSLLAAALVLMVVIGPTATVVVAPVPTALGPIEFDLRAGPDGEISSALTLVANDLTQKYGAKATGERLEPIKAKGVARFSNRDTQEVRVLKGTIVRTRDNVRFQTMDEKVIPRSTIEIFPIPGVKIGTVDIPIEALDAGTGGNVAANTITVTERSDFGVTNPQATGGGEIKKFAVITGSDYGLAAGRADEELRKRAQQQVEEWRKTTEKGWLVYGPVTKVTAVTSSDGLIGSEPPNGTFELTVTGTATAYRVPENEPRATTIAKLKEHAASQNDINEAAAVVDVIIEPTLLENGVRWRVRAHTTQFPQVRNDPLRASLAGREFGEVESVVQGQGLQFVRLEIWPGWWPRLPFFDSRLRIQVETATTATSESP
ncbi:MAG TPA: baseplate J/gp47 family protein [Candidatus Limnocylindria bacterium]|nr:baseplate J/gp47 family protein [Candidatus Limnocylindria bacterium]